VLGESESVSVSVSASWNASFYPTDRPSTPDERRLRRRRIAASDPVRNLFQVFSPRVTCRRRASLCPAGRRLVSRLGSDAAAVVESRGKHDVMDDVSWRTCIAGRSPVVAVARSTARDFRQLGSDRVPGEILLTVA